MKRVSLAALATLALIGAAACQDAITSPQGGTDLSLRYRVSNPPPPPADTGAQGSFTPGSPTLRAEPSWRLFQPRYSIQGSSSPQSLSRRPRFLVNSAPASGPAYSSQASYNFHIPVTYMFSPAGKNGYLHFSSDEANGVNAASNGMIKVKDGVLSGKGILTIDTFDGVVVIDLSSIKQPPSFVGCGTETVGGVCFFLQFTDATFYPDEGGQEDGYVNMDPACPPSNEACFEE